MPTRLNVSTIAAITVVRKFRSIVFIVRFSLRKSKLRYVRGIRTLSFNFVGSMATQVSYQTCLTSNPQFPQDNEMKREMKSCKSVTPILSFAPEKPTDNGQHKSCRWSACHRQFSYNGKTQLNRTQECVAELITAMLAGKRAIP